MLSRCWVVPLIVVGSLLTVGITVMGFFAYASHDRFELIDSHTVYDAASIACREIRAEVDDLNQPPVPSRRALVSAENRAIEVLIGRVRAVGRKAIDGDAPTRKWLDDWQSLHDTRAGYEAALADDPGALRPKLPTVDGYSIAMRMQDPGVNCQFPKGLIDDVQIVGKAHR